MSESYNKDPKNQKTTSDNTIIYSSEDLKKATSKEASSRGDSFIAASNDFDVSRGKNRSAGYHSPWEQGSYTSQNISSRDTLFEVPDFLSSRRSIPEEKVKVEDGMVSISKAALEDSNRAQEKKADPTNQAKSPKSKGKASGFFSGLIVKLEDEELSRNAEPRQEESQAESLDSGTASPSHGEASGAYGSSDMHIPPFYATQEEEDAAKKAEEERKQAAAAATAAPSRMARKGRKPAQTKAGESPSGHTAKSNRSDKKGKSVAASGEASGSGKAEFQEKDKKKKKKRHPFLMLIAALFGLFLIGASAAFIFVYSIIAKTPSIEPSEFHSLLTETSVMYDQNGKVIGELSYGGDRETVDIEQIPENLSNAFIALEDKTFRTHHGFNFIRMVGAIRDALVSGGEITGTSTITQQVARNLWIKDDQYTHSYRRKLIEAYYATQIEKELTKDEILEAYLNTIYFGYNSYGVQAAARNYFSKDVSTLTVAECAALAALPQAPDAYQLVKFVEGGSKSTYASTLLKETSDGVYVANDLSKSRRDACLDLMLAQGYISQAEHDQAINTSLMSILKPDFSNLETTTSYFMDYAVNEVIQDLMNEKGYDYNKAWTTVYQGGLEIYTTLDPQAQEVLDREFEEAYNYPAANPYFDGAGNIINSEGDILLLSYDNYFDESGVYTLPEGVMERRSDGSAILHYSDHLNIYETEVQGARDYSIEFKDMYFYDDEWFLYSISGGFINIPQNFKTSGGDDGVIIAKEFWETDDYKDFIRFNEDGTVSIYPGIYSLNSRTRQPQAAMTIVENSTGNIKAMIGGRGIKGRMIYNRATSTHQPGSSIKPLGVYSAAIQQSAEEYYNGEKHTFVNYHIDKQGADLYGDYLTAASVVLDERTTIDGEVWPKNFSRSYTGYNTMRSAIVSSINTCAVKIVMQVGYDYSFNMIKKFGISTLVDEGDYNDLNPAALALGGMTYGVNTLEMASAYTVFPNNGIRYATSSYTKVLDSDGNILLENNPEPEQVLDPGVAWIMADMLRDVVVKSSSAAAIEDVYVGGKTGTATGEGDAYCDIWFDGFTQNYTASLWIGNDKMIPLSDYSSAATNFWGNVMRQIDGSYIGERAEMPGNVIYTSGEYFIDGTQTGIQGRSSIVKKLSICTESGLIATKYCPETETVEYVNYGDEAQKIPTQTCNIHTEDEEEKKKQEEEEEKKKQEEEEKAKKEAEEKAKKEAEEAAAQKAAEEKAQKEAEEKAKKEAEAKAAAEEAARKAAEEEAARKAAEEEAARKAAEEQARKEQEEAEAARKAAEEEAARQAAEEQARKEQEEAEAARKAAEEEAARQAAEEQAQREQEEAEAAQQQQEEDTSQESQPSETSEDSSE